MSSSELSNFFVSVISDSPKNVFSNLELFRAWGVGGLHFDVMDGLFVPRLGLYPELLRDIRNSSSLFIEVHLMLAKPSNYLEQFAESGANRFLFHVETQEALGTLIAKTRSLGIEVGIVLSPETSVSDCVRYLDSVDSVMLMAIKPGIPRHPFLDSTYSKLEELNQAIEALGISINVQIDGGITFSNVERLLGAGVRTLICGSGTVFAPESETVSNLLRLKQIVKNFNSL